MDGIRYETVGQVPGHVESWLWWTVKPQAEKTKALQTGERSRYEIRRDEKRRDERRRQDKGNND